MDMRIAGAALTLLVMTDCPAFAQSQPAPAAIPQSLPKPSLVPADFDVPTVAETADFKLVPLGLKVGMSTMRDKIGLEDPGKDEELLVSPRQAQPAPIAAPLLP